jgi:Fe-S cluster biogenesis protein NfuA
MMPSASGPGGSHAVLEQIQKVLDEEVRPGLQAGGSDLELLSFDRGVVQVRLTGPCGCCPSVAWALLQEIERLLRQRVSAVEYLETTG